MRRECERVPWVTWSCTDSLCLTTLPGDDEIWICKKNALFSFLVQKQNDHPERRNKNKTHCSPFLFVTFAERPTDDETP